MRRAKGITLVALVVTIVIILILAGVGIATISGENGILRKAVEAKEKTEIAGLKERIELVQQDWFIDKTLDPTVTEDDFFDKLIDDGIINSKGDVTGPEKEGDNDIYTLETDDGYKVEIIVDPDGDIEIGDIGKDKDLTLKIRNIEATEKTENSITVSVNVRGTGTDEIKVSYYYKTEDEDEYHELIGGQDTTDLEATFTGLEEGTTYNIKVVATEGDKTVELVKDITTEAKKITETVTAGTAIWDESTHTASVELSTTTSYKIQWKKEGATRWETETGSKTVTNLRHNDTIIARLWNGKTAGPETKVKVEDKQPPTVTVSKGAVTSNSIQVSVTSSDGQWGMPINPTYNYYIKKKADANYPTTPAKTGTEATVTLDGLEQGTAYTIKVTTTDKAGNEGEGKLGETEEEIKTETVEGAGTDLAEGVLTASAPTWDPTEHKATITLTTTTDYQIQWQKGGIDADGWTTVPAGTKTTTVPDLEHGNMVYARLYDGKNAGNEASVKVEDGDDPENATITGLPTEAISEGEKITATVVHTDNQSGVKVADCKWKFTTSQDTKLGTEATSYAGEMSGSFTSESENIECTANTAGTYWLHVLTVDKAGNKVETVSGTSVTVEQAGISAGDIANDDEAFKKVAGGKVTNYSDGQDIEWKVFYADTNGIYLIASDYVPVSKLTSQKSTLGFTTNGSYNIYWNSSSDFKVTSIDSTVANRFMLNKLSTFSTGNNNYKMTACLIDATKWNTFRDARWVDENDIIGGPTLEMYVASWNKKYPSNKLYTNANSTGYYVGTSANPSTTAINMSSTPGYSDTLYYPHTGSSAWNGCYGYWLASPSADDTNYEMHVRYSGLVGNNGYSNDHLGVRPVVHLKSGVKLKEVGADFELVQ